MKVRSIICIYRQHHALLELKTDLGKARIDLSDIKMGCSIRIWFFWVFGNCLHCLIVGKTRRALIQKWWMVFQMIRLSLNWYVVLLMMLTTEAVSIEKYFFLKMRLVESWGGWFELPFNQIVMRILKNWSTCSTRRVCNPFTVIWSGGGVGRCRTVFLPTFHPFNPWPTVLVAGVRKGNDFCVPPKNCIYPVHPEYPCSKNPCFSLG